MDGGFVKGCPAAGGGAPSDTYGCVEIASIAVTASLHAEPTQSHRMLASWPAAAVIAAAAGALLAVSARLRRRAMATTPAAAEAGAQML
jgi:hypothetical protein